MVLNFETDTLIRIEVFKSESTVRRRHIPTITIPSRRDGLFGEVFEWKGGKGKAKISSSS